MAKFEKWSTRTLTSTYYPHHIIVFKYIKILLNIVWINFSNLNQGY